MCSAKTSRRKPDGHEEITSTIPIVFVIASDPVKIGLAKSLAHPGGNATGVSMLTARLTLKRLELIRELLPPHATVGLLVNPDNNELLLEIEQIARSTGQPLEVAKARNPDDLEPAFAQLVRAQVGSCVMRTSPSIVPGADRPTYLVLDHVQSGSAWRETDEDGADLETLLRELRDGQYSSPVRIVSFNTSEGWSRDVSEEVADELRQRCADLGEVPPSLEDFLARHQPRQAPRQLKLPMHWSGC